MFLPDVFFKKGYLPNDNNLPKSQKDILIDGFVRMNLYKRVLVEYTSYIERREAAAGEKYTETNWGENPVLKNGNKAGGGIPI